MGHPLFNRTFRALRAVSLFSAVFLLGTAVAPLDASAANNRRSGHDGIYASKPSVYSKQAELVIDMDKGEVVHAKNASDLRHPASLTKMMTLYMLFEALENNELKLSSRISFSEHAASMPQTNLLSDAGDTIDVDSAIKALVVRSANDVAAAVAEKLGGTESNFARMMTSKALKLGMSKTEFYNASGLPDARQVTTARDLALLGIALKKHFPQYYPYFKTKEFTYNGRTYKTHNRVMLNYSGAEGIKTGYIRASGFNLVTSAKRGGRQLMAVVMGGDSGRARDARMMQLLDQAYQQVAGLPPVARNVAVASVAPKASKGRVSKTFAAGKLKTKKLAKTGKTIKRKVASKKIRSKYRLGNAGKSALSPTGRVIASL